MFDFEGPISSDPSMISSKAAEGAGASLQVTQLGGIRDRSEVALNIHRAIRAPEKSANFVEQSPKIYGCSDNSDM